MFLLQQHFVFSRMLLKTKEKAQNIHVLRDWRHVIYIFLDYRG